MEEAESTAIASESESEPAESQVSTPARRWRRRKRRKFTPNFDIPGVHKMVLKEFTQHEIGCVVGKNVTAEKPWISVERDTIQEHLDLHSESSEFLPMKEQVAAYSGTEFFVGYIPDESKDYDEFYFCVTEEATETVQEIVDKLQRIQAEKLKNATNRKIKRWKSQGSEKEIDEGILKSHRALIEVEIESKYPILPFKVHFRTVKAQDMRDGYMELRSSDDASTIFKRRIDAFIQVAPSVGVNDAQTLCSYPKNAHTQYQYEIPPHLVPTEEDAKHAEDFVTQNLEPFCDILKVNGCIDLYSNDYEDLVLNPGSTVKIELPASNEYVCFIDMNLCRGKMVSSLSWHPLWTGCAVVSYVDVSPNIYLTNRITTDEVYEAIHDTHPVLFWSFNDDLKPKLILETPRPVYALSCCPYNENIIIGGCVNGQIIIWDITNKLNKVEEEEILTVDQQNYRTYINSLMGWMKNIFDVARVRYTALSDLKYSHRGCINSIIWLSPMHKVGKTGKMEDSEEQNTLEFVTSSEDGTLMIWDLLKKPVVTPGGFKAIRKMQRLKKRPSALLTMESPFKTLHLNIKPVYKVNLIHPSRNRLLCASCFYADFFKTEYELSTEKKKVKLSDRLIYKPILRAENCSPNRKFHVGTFKGQYFEGIWEGQEFDSGEIVNFEDAQYRSMGEYHHDGSIVSIEYCRFNGTILTVGGRVFALWREDFPNRPVLWRKGKSIYTNGSWFIFEQASIRLVRMDGYVEFWTLFHKSKSATEVRLTANGQLILSSGHPRPLKYNVLGFCDYRGLLRLFYTKHEDPLSITSKREVMSAFITKEVERKKALLQWQHQWNERHKHDTKSTEEVKEEVVEFEIPEATPRRRVEKPKIVKVSPGLRYLQAVKDQHKAHEQGRIKSIILAKKQIDTEELLKRREPLRKLEEENEVKRHKQKQRMKESEKIFKETVAMLFPDVVKEKPPPPPDPYEDYYSEDYKKDNYLHYQETSIDAQDYVEENPFNYEFNWRLVLKTGREKRQKLDETFKKLGHKQRYEKVKRQKAKLAEESAASEAASNAGQSAMSISEFSRDVIPEF